MSKDVLAEIYRSLAEVYYLAPGEHLPEWFSYPGKEWPLLKSVSSLAGQQLSPKFEKAINAIKIVPGGSISSRENEYRSLFIGDKRPPIWLYGSYYLNGSVPGPTTFTLRDLYSQFGLVVDGGELADHASIELAFLAFLVEQESGDKVHAAKWRSIQRTFLKTHFLQWFPKVMKGVRNSSFPTWEAIGAICEAVLFSDEGIRKTATAGRNVPFLKNVSECTLCGFCFRVCRTRALSIEENEITTALLLTPERCNGCQKCIKVCPEGVLLIRRDMGGVEQALLKESPRSICPACKTPTISEAELAHVSSKLGNPEWLLYCLECRTKSPMFS